MMTYASCNVIIIKYLTKVEKHNKYERHNLVPQILPSDYETLLGYLPFINYPDATHQKIAQQIKQQFNAKLTFHPDGFYIFVVPKEMRSSYLQECRKLKDMINHPLDANDANLIRKYEELNNITINIYNLQSEAYNPTCKKKLHNLWSAKYMTDKKAKDIKLGSHLDLMIIREEYGKKIVKGIDISTFRPHFVWLLDAIELITYTRTNRP